MYELNVVKYEMCSFYSFLEFTVIVFVDSLGQLWICKLIGEIQRNCLYKPYKINKGKNKLYKNYIILTFLKLFPLYLEISLKIAKTIK